MALPGDDTPSLADQLKEARSEAAYYRKLAQECGARRLREAEELSAVIERLRRTEIVLKQARDEADAANTAKSRFLANMSHELRTPLTAIIGYAELLDETLDSAAGDDIRRDLGRIRSAGAHLLSIIGDVLDLARIEAGHQPVAISQVSLPLLIASVADTIRPLADRNQNQFEVVGAGSAGFMETDEIHLRQILINLLGNACKFTAAGTVVLNVSLITGTRAGDPGRVLFTVRDTGIGMRPEELTLLFNEFVQVDASATRRYSGSGLGLALSQRLAHLLGGDISVTSVPNEGSTFTLSLPRTRTGASPPLFA